MHNRKHNRQSHIYCTLGWPCYGQRQALLHEQLILLNDGNDLFAVPNAIDVQVGCRTSSGLSARLPKHRLAVNANCIILPFLDKIDL